MHSPQLPRRPPSSKHGQTLQRASVHPALATINKFFSNPHLRHCPRQSSHCSVIPPTCCSSQRLSPVAFQISIGPSASALSLFTLFLPVSTRTSRSRQPSSLAGYVQRELTALCCELSAAVLTQAVMLRLRASITTVWVSLQLHQPN